MSFHPSTEFSYQSGNWIEIGGAYGPLNFRVLVLALDNLVDFIVTCITRSPSGGWLGMGASLDADGYDSPATKEIRKFMRLSPDQIQSIRFAATATFGQGTAVWLFGSRVDDTKKGGDIDLLVRPIPAEANQPFVKKIRMLTLLERLLGERKVDLVIEQPHDARPIVSVAHATGIQLQ